jgi:hydrogenase nickel incorporation protein HypA/HybF
MHELYATRAILEKSLEKGSERKAKRITDLHLVLGDISPYSDEAVLFCWEQISRGTIAEGATLHIRHVAAEMQCMACFVKYHPRKSDILCPKCGSLGARILSGEELYLEELGIE